MIACLCFTVKESTFVRSSILQLPDLLCYAGCLYVQQGSLQAMRVYFKLWSWIGVYNEFGKVTTAVQHKTKEQQ